METTTKKVLAVYTVVQKGDGKEIWLRVGSAFTNRDGSLSVLLDAVPTNGKLQVREYMPRELGNRPRGDVRDVRDVPREGAL
jgi:hypothetical protein